MFPRANLFWTKGLKYVRKASKDRNDEKDKRKIPWYGQDLPLD